MAQCTFHRGIELKNYEHRVVVYLQIVKKKPINFPNFVWFSESVLTALCTFHKDILRNRENMNIGLWFIFPNYEKSPNSSPNVVWFSEPSLMAMYFSKRYFTSKKYENESFDLGISLQRCSWRCVLYL